MIRNRLHLALIHRLRTGFGEAGSRRHQPEFSLLATAAPSSDLEAAGIDSLFGFTTREIGLGIDRTLGCQILALLELIWIGKAHDHYLGVGLVLQGLCNVVKHGLAGIVDTPRLRLVREGALAQLARLRRRWRWLLDVNLRIRSGGQATRVSTRRTHRDGTCWSSGCIQRPSIAASGDRTSGCGPRSNIHRHIVGTLAFAGDGC